MITITDYIDAVAAERRIPRVTLSPEAMIHAERYVREFGEELAEAAINHAIRTCERMHQRPFDGPHLAKSRTQRLRCVLSDTNPLIEPPPEKSSSSK